MKHIIYILEIYKPETTEALAFFEAKTPFQGMQVGDFINPRQWNNNAIPTNTLQVITVQHTISEENDHIKHKISISTEEVVAYTLVEVERVQIGDDY